MSNSSPQNVDPAVQRVRAENPGIITLQAVLREIRLKFRAAPKQTPIVLGEGLATSSTSDKATFPNRVVVPGFSGWGQPLLGAVNYFGGFSDLAATLAAEGYIIIQVRLSPISSNKERACEIFRQLTNIRGPNAAGIAT